MLRVEMQLMSGSNYLKSYDMGGTRVIGVLSRSLLLVLLIVGGGKLANYPDVVVVLAFGFIASILLSRGEIRVYSGGILVTNILRERFYPWAAISRVDAGMRVELVDQRNVAFRCWAVQRSNIAAASGKGSRVDDVAGEIRTLMHEMQIGNPYADVTWSQRVRFAWHEYLQVFVILPLAVWSGYLVLG